MRQKIDELTANHTYLVSRSRLYVQRLLIKSIQVPGGGGVGVGGNLGQTKARDMPLERAIF